MARETTLLLADLRIDVANECVWRGEQALTLPPTAFALLRYLIEHAGRLVSKDELLAALWAQTAVTEGVLTTHVRQIRQALGDDPKTPQFIETVHRRGYRFIAPVTTAQPVASSRFQVSSSRPQPTPTPQFPTPSFVGRETELEQLHRWLEKALSGKRQIVFVTGEPGIGKTTVV
jgi:DNA-binding winged helix-turn-helix (wHTH) protein